VLTERMRAMVTCPVDAIPRELAPPTQEAIERQRQKQMKALTEVRRLLIEKVPLAKPSPRPGRGRATATP